jgi:hypothetical protein
MPDVLIHRQNSYAPRGKRRTGRCEAQNRGTGQKSKNPRCIALKDVFVLVCIRVIYPKWLH